MAVSPMRSLNVLSRSLKLSPIKTKHKNSTSLNVVFNNSNETACSRSPMYWHHVNALSSPPTIYKRKKNCEGKVSYSVESDCSLYHFQKETAINYNENFGKWTSPELSLNTPDRTKLPNVIRKNGIKYFLGNGAFGTVLRGNYKGEKVAVKILSKQKISSLKNEANALHIGHLNIIKIFKIVKEEDYGLVFMERNFGPNMHDFLHKMCITLTSLNRVRYMLNIAHALDFCHRKKILHLDVKPKNILLSISNNTCKLCDFGCSIHIDELDYYYLQVKNLGVNTVCYTDPQLLCGERPSSKADVYSFGITMWQMISQEVPYEGIACQTIIYKVVAENIRPKEMQGKTKYDKSYIDLYQLCWSTQPSLRPEMDIIIEEIKNILMKEKLEGNDRKF